MSQRPFDVVIAGGGFAGLVTAAALAQRDFSVCVLEPHAEPPDVLRGELLHARGVRVPDELGLLAPLRARGALDLQGFAVFAPQGSAGHETPLTLDYRRGSGLGVEHRFMLTVLREQLVRERRVEFRVGARMESLLRERDRVIGVRCAGGELLRGRLIVAADGRHSKVRKELGLQASVQLLSHMIGTTVPTSALPLPRRGHVFTGAPGPVLAYPYSQDSVRAQFDVDIAVAKAHGGVNAYIQAQYLPHVPEPLRSAMREALAQRPTLASANHAIYTLQCVVPGAALVGDAAGCSHPLTATGMTMALNDAKVLAECLGKHGLSDAALLEYQRQRNAFVRARETFAHALYEVFRGEAPGARALREGLFEYWSVPGARQASMDILTGEESGLRALIAEYIKVIGVSCRGAMPPAEVLLQSAHKGAALGSLTGVLRTAGRSASFATDRMLARLTTSQLRALRPAGDELALHPLSRAPIAGGRRLQRLLQRSALGGAAAER